MYIQFNYIRIISSGITILYCFICIVYTALKLISQTSSGKWSVATTDFKVMCLKGIV